jgi:hypothetical protein
MASTKKKNKLSPKEYLEREAYLPEYLVNLILETVANNFDPRRCPEHLYWTYLEAMSVADSAEAQIDMLVDILTLGWSKGVNLIGHGDLVNVLSAAEKGAADASNQLRVLLCKECALCSGAV